MNKEEILAKSRKELKNADLAEKEVTLKAWNTAGKTGAVVCCLITAYNSFQNNYGSYSLWTVYFSMLTVKTLITYNELKEKSDLALGIVYAFLCAAFFVLHILKSVGIF